MVDTELVDTGAYLYYGAAITFDASYHGFIFQFEKSVCVCVHQQTSICIYCNLELWKFAFTLDKICSN